MPVYSWNTDRTQILKISKTIEYEEDSFKVIAKDLENEFKGSVFESTPIKVILNPKEDSTKNKAIWYITSDSSLNEIYREDGFENYKSVEFITRAIPSNQLVQSIDFISDLFARKKVITNDECSMHSNIGFKTTRNLDLLKITILTKDDEELKTYGRENNEYTVSLLTSIKDASTINGEAIKIIQKNLNTFNNIDFSKFLNTANKKQAINFIKWVTPKTGYDPVLEFRIIGGSNYLPGKKSNIIKSIQRFFGIVAIAGDPELYKQDYLRKLFLLYKDSKTNETDNDKPNKIKTVLNKLNELIRKQTLSDTELSVFTYTIRTMLDSLKLPINFSEFKTVSPTIKEIYSKPQLVSALIKVREDIETESFLAKFNKLFPKLDGLIHP